MPGIRPTDRVQGPYGRVLSTVRCRLLENGALQARRKSQDQLGPVPVEAQVLHIFLEHPAQKYLLLHSVREPDGTADLWPHCLVALWHRVDEVSRMLLAGVPL